LTSDDGPGGALALPPDVYRQSALPRFARVYGGFAGAPPLHPAAF